MRAAVAARPARRAPGLLAVTVLTSMDDADLRAAGYASDAAALVAARAADAKRRGHGRDRLLAARGADVRRVVGADMMIVTPGVRPAGAAAGDQKRVATPEEAIRPAPIISLSGGR